MTHARIGNTRLDIDLPLPNGITALYGPAGAGKTAILEGDGRTFDEVAQARLSTSLEVGAPNLAQIDDAETQERIVTPA